MPPGTNRFMYPVHADEMLRAALAQGVPPQQIAAQLARMCDDRDRALEDFLGQSGFGEPVHDQNTWEYAGSWSFTCNVSGADQSHNAPMVTFTLAQPADMPSLAGNLFVWIQSEYSITWVAAPVRTSLFFDYETFHTVDTFSGSGIDDIDLQQRFFVNANEVVIVQIGSMIVVPYNAGDSHTIQIIGDVGPPGLNTDYNMKTIAARSRVHAFFEPGIPVTNQWVGGG